MQLDLPLLTLDNSKVSLTLHTLYHALFKAWLIAWPLAFPGGMFVIKYCATDSGLVTRIRVFFRRFREYAWARVRPQQDLYYRHYKSAEEEDEYWQSSERMRRALWASDARADDGNKEIPLVRYYTPRLLPTYREAEEEDPEATEVYLSPKAYCKWHRMVFPGPMHPTLKEAPAQIKHYSSRDRREILRISRLVSDKDIIHRGGWSSKGSNMWRQWLDSKGPDVAIVFE